MGYQPVCAVADWTTAGADQPVTDEGEWKEREENGRKAESNLGSVKSHKIVYSRDEEVGK